MTDEKDENDDDGSQIKNGKKTSLHFDFSTIGHEPQWYNLYDELK